MRSLKIIIKKYDVPDNTKTIREDAEFIGIAKMPIDIHLFGIGRGSSLRRHKPVGHLVGIHIRLVL